MFLIISMKGLSVPIDFNMIVVSVTLYHHYSLQFIVTEGLSQKSNSYLEVLDFWPSHNERDANREKIRLFREFLGSLRIVVTFGGSVKAAKHARPLGARKIANVVLTVNGKTASMVKVDI